MKPVILLLAKAAIATSPRQEMQELCDAVALRNPDFTVTYALQELGTPSLHERLTELADQKVEDVIITSLIFPMEPAFPAWIRTSVHRWAKKREGGFPRIRIAPPPMAQTDSLSELISTLVFAVDETDALSTSAKIPKGSVIPEQKYRLLVCMGGACNDAGANALYSHVRLQQDRLKLRSSKPGMMSCKTSCLGPCSLAPVVQVWPDGTMYCDVTEEKLDIILEEHIKGGSPVNELLSPVNGKRQSLKTSLI